MTIGRNIIATLIMPVIELIQPWNGKRENGEREHCGKAETVFLVRRYTTTSGIPDTIVLSPIGNPATRESGIIRKCTSDRIIETSAQKTWISQNRRNIGKHLDDSVMLYKTKIK